MIGYHFLQANMRAGEGSERPWTVGETRTLKSTKAIVPCAFGYHASPTLWDALNYAPGPVACLVELDDATAVPDGEPVDKYAARSRRLIAAADINRELRLFAADCAANVLWIYERDYPNDDRPRRAIQAAREFANGEIDEAAMAGARAAAWAAARAAARAAAWDAAAFAARAAAFAAGDAAFAVWDVRDASGYARDASGYARDAAFAARAAAWAVAFAARAAARAAAWDAEQAWQLEQFEARFGGIFAALAELAR